MLVSIRELIELGLAEEILENELKQRKLEISQDIPTKFRFPFLLYLDFILTGQIPDSYLYYLEPNNPDFNKEFRQVELSKIQKQIENKRTPVKINSA